MPRKLHHLAIAACTLLLVPGLTAQAGAAATDPPGTLTSQNVSGDPASPFRTYRIPALAALPNNVLVAAWDGRPNGDGDSPNPNSIVMKRSTDGGQTWGALKTIRAGSMSEPKTGYSDPSLLYDAQAGKLFMFSVYSKDQGFGGSAWGNDDNNRQVISTQVSESTDGGETWSGPRMLTNVAKPAAGGANPVAGDVRSMFATSGAGIQLKYGAHAGRLIQQYAGDVRQSNGSNAIQAYSLYSDDHGATWQRSAFVGTGMDENKVVELSDGRVLLNSRDNFRGGYRKVAISTDGGRTYGPVSQDTELPDPTNNASISRIFPNAPQGSREAKMLLFTNTASQGDRVNLTARVSCNDGESWPYARQIDASYSGYSTAARIAPGKFGVLYENQAFSAMRWASFDDAWLAAPCDGLATIDKVTVAGFRADSTRNLSSTPYAAGEQVPYSFTVRNNGTAASTITPTAGSFTGLTPDTAANCRASNLVGGSSRTCHTAKHTVTQGEVAQGYFVPETTWSVTGNSTGEDRTYGFTVPLKGGIQSGTATVNGIRITGARNDGARDLATSPYGPGSSLGYSFHVTNTTAQTVDVVPTAGNFSPFVPSGIGNCRYIGLAPGQSYVCHTPKHTVTDAEAAQRYFVPDTTWSVTRNGNTSSSRLLGAAVELS